MPGHHPRPVHAVGHASSLANRVCSLCRQSFSLHEKYFNHVGTGWMPYCRTCQRARIRAFWDLKAQEEENLDDFIPTNPLVVCAVCWKDCVEEGTEATRRAVDFIEYHLIHAPDPVLRNKLWVGIRAYRSAHDTRALDYALRLVEQAS